MANVFWVGGTGTWNTTTTHWSLTSGGGGGSLPPAAGDTAVFDNNSGGGTVTISGARTCLALNCTGFTGSFAGTGTLSVGSSAATGTSIIFGSGMGGGSFTGTFSLLSTVTGNTITTNGVAFGGSSMAININGAGGSWQLQDNMTTTADFTFTKGSLDLNNKNLSCGSISFAANSQTRVFTMGSSTITLTDSSGWTDLSTGGLTLSTSSPTIVVAQSCQFAVAQSLANVAVTVNSGFTLTGGTGLKLGMLTLLHGSGLMLHVSTTNTITGLAATGNSGSTISINSNSAGIAATLSCAGGLTISCDWLVIQDSSVSGSTFYAGANSTNVSDNSGWIFTAPPSGGPTGNPAQLGWY